MEEGDGCYGHSNAPLIHTICLKWGEERQSVSGLPSLAYLFKKIQLPAKFKCCSQIRTYKVSQPGSEGFHNGRAGKQ